jgi:HK97 family phage major capsid protein
MPEGIGVKGADGKPVEFSEVIASVNKEITTLSDNSKKVQEIQNKSITDMRSLTDEVKGKLDDPKVWIDPLLKEAIHKYTEEVSARQDLLDKKAHERIDKLDLALQRTGKSWDDITKPEERAAEAKQFELQCMLKDHKGGITHNDIVAMDFDNKAPNLDSYANYRKAFRSYMASPGDERHITPDNFKLLSVGQDPDGGFWVPVQQSNRIIMRMFEVDPLRQLAGQITISSDRLRMGVDVDDFDDSDTHWQGEKTSIQTDGNPQTGEKQIVVHTLVTQPKMTQQLLEDAVINPEQWLADKIASKYERVEGAAFVNGNGVSKPRGFLTYPSTWVEGTAGVGNIEQVNMGNATALTTDGFTKVMYSLVEGFLFRGIWLMNRTTVRDAMLLKDGDGQYIWRQGLQAGQPSIILTVPVRMSTTMPVVAANALSVAIADWREAYLIVDRIGISTMRDPFTAKPFILFYTRKRVGGDVVNFQAIKIGKIAA